MPAQDFPVKMLDTMAWWTPNLLAILDWLSPPALANAYISRASCRVSTLRRPGVVAALAEAIGEGLVVSPGEDSQVPPLRKAAANQQGKPSFSPICLPFNSPAAIKEKASSTSSLLYAPVECPRDHLCSRPLSLAWAEFSEGEQYSRLLKLLFVLSRSLWFTQSLPVGGVPAKASSTTLCTLTSFTRPPTCSPTYTYPFTGLGVRLSSSPLRLWVTDREELEAPHTKVTSLSSDLTRPKSLTSYKPSYPTTAFQFSTSIFTSFRGFAPSLRFLIHRIISVLQGTVRLPSGLAQPEPRHVDRPMLGAFPALGLGCRS